MIVWTLLVLLALSGILALVGLGAVIRRLTIADHGISSGRANARVGRPSPRVTFTAQQPRLVEDINQLIADINRLIEAQQDSAAIPASSVRSTRGLEELAAAVRRLADITQTEAALQRGSAREEAMPLATDEHSESAYPSEGQIGIDELVMAGMTEQIAIALARLNSLSPRERDIFEMLGLGYDNRSIASQMTLSERTVKRHVSEILRKLQLASRMQAALTAQLSRFIAPSLVNSIRTEFGP